jgi:GxxExxY protein
MKPVSSTSRVGPADVPPEWNRVSSLVIGAAMSVHTEIGPGLLERFYETALEHELGLVGLRVRRQHPVRVSYKGVDLGLHVLDLVVEDLIVLELKAADEVHDTHLAQLVSSMRLAKLPLGLLINFNVASLKQGIHRRILTKGTPTPSAFIDELDSV